MRITFVVPSVNLSGGIRVVATYADRLTQRGHKVTVVSPGISTLSFWQRIKFLLKGGGWIKEGEFYLDPIKFNKEYFDSSGVNLKILDVNRPVDEADVPDADVVIATFWTTAEWVSGYASNKGRKVYFIQDHEVWPAFPIDRVKATLRLPFQKITISKWLVEVMKEQYGDSNISLVPNGVDTVQFSASERKKNSVLTLGLVYFPGSYKGCDVAFKAIEEAKMKVPNLKVITFSRIKPTEKIPLPDNTEFYFQPAQSEISNIYSKCDAWLFASRCEGFGLPILEAMACRTPVIGTYAGAAPELLDNGEGILVDVDDSHMMADAILRISEMNDSEWKAMSDSAYVTACKHTWDKSVVLFEEALEKVLHE